ncbi:MAG: alpha/beta fold hydrolase, partial [Akkermansiaceae bacterium]|nr:alpha/beta fold hydrolase [Armatimonadota bacterium]
MKRIATIATAITLVSLLAGNAVAFAQSPETAVPEATARATATDGARIRYRTIKIEGLKIFYREAGDPKKPTILLLHGFPTSSHMFRDLIPLLANDYHLVAPDYPGFGNSDAPPADAFKYTFDHLTDIVEQFTTALNLDRYSLYVQDYGAPIGYRLAARHPEKVQAIISQNGNAYDEGLTPFWKPLQDAYWKNPNDEAAKPLRGLLKAEGTRFQYETGVRDKSHINPDAWLVPQVGLDRPGNDAIQLALFYDYRTNPPLYPTWHEYFRKHQPPTLVVWGKNDPIFGPEGAKAFLRDLPNAELHLLETGHFA